MAHTCPRCRTPLAPQTASHDGRTVTVDACGDCGGLFLERGELVRLAPAGASVEQFAAWLPRESELLTGHDVKCPACAGYMRIVAVEALELRLDICGGCKGFWFDRRELETLQRLAGKLRLRADTGVAAPGEEETDSWDVMGVMAEVLVRGLGNMLMYMV